MSNEEGLSDGVLFAGPIPFHSQVIPLSLSGRSNSDISMSSTFSETDSFVFGSYRWCDKYSRGLAP